MAAKKKTTAKKKAITTSPSPKQTRGKTARAGAKATSSTKRAGKKQSVKKGRRSPHGATPLLVVAGEHSGDLLGAGIVRHLRSMGYESFFGTGGQHMLEEGVDCMDTVDNMTVVGFVEALFAYSKLKKLARRLIDRAREEGVQTAILVDYPGFNLRFAAMLKEAGIHTVQVVAPQIWAWKYGRIKKIQKHIDLILPLFAFEKEIYDREGVESHVIGHPLLSELPDRLAKEKPFARFEPTNIALLPGSRRTEISRLLVPMLDAAQMLETRFPGQIRFLLPGIHPEMQPFIEEQIHQRKDQLHIEFAPGRSLRMMKTADVVVLASGTATLEAAWLQKPMVILYKVSALNFLIASILVRTSHIGLANILAENPPAVELLQSEVTAENIFQEVSRILENNAYRRGIVRELKKVRGAMGEGEPAHTAAMHIDRFIADNS